MTDLVGTALSWILIVAASAYMVYHYARTIRLWRLETKSAVAIMFSTGVLVMVTPKKIFPDLPQEAVNTLSWVAVGMILAAIVIDILGTRERRDAASSDTSSEPANKR